MCDQIELLPSILLPYVLPFFSLHLARALTLSVLVYERVYKEVEKWRVHGKMKRSCLDNPKRTYGKSVDVKT